MDYSILNISDLEFGKEYVILNGNTKVGSVKVRSTEYVVKTNTGKHKYDKDGFESFIKTSSYKLASEPNLWESYNPNPKEVTSASDCTLRAYCKAENITWTKAYDIAVEKGKEIGYMPNDDKVVRSILIDKYGYEYTKVSEYMKVYNFTENHMTGKYILDLPHHMVTVINGKYFDCWDSGNKRVIGYYHKS